MHVQAYLFFDGRCEEAVEFYRTALGADHVRLTRYKDSPDQSMVAPGTEEKIMHGELRIGDTTVLVADGRCGGDPKFDGFSMAIRANDDAHAARCFNGLAQGGTVQMPLTKTFFASSFGMVADRFGVNWMVIVETPIA